MGELNTHPSLDILGGPSGTQVQIDGVSVSVEVERVSPTICRFDHFVGIVGTVALITLPNIGVVTSAAGHDIAASAAVDDVISGIAKNRIISGFSVGDIVATAECDRVVSGIS